MLLSRKSPTMKRLFTASLLCLGAAAGAQTNVLGKVADVQGIVTISDGATMSTAVPGTLITDGNRVVTATSGAARLTMDNGCVINLKPNESLTIKGGISCRDLLAAIQSVGSNPALAAAAGGGGGGVGMGTGLAVGAGALLAAGLAGGGGGGSSSPNGGGTGGGTGGGGGGIPVVPISGQ
jgi:hypothetical protein